MSALTESNHSYLSHHFPNKTEFNPMKTPSPMKSPKRLNSLQSPNTTSTKLSARRRLNMENELNSSNTANNMPTTRLPKSPIVGSERHEQERIIRKSLDIVDFSAFYSNTQYLLDRETIDKLLNYYIWINLQISHHFLFWKNLHPNGWQKGIHFSSLSPKRTHCNNLYGMSLFLSNFVERGSRFQMFSCKSQWEVE